MKYTLLAAHGPFIVGQVVYDLRFYDYGLAADDTRNLGIEHVSVTLDPNGGYPSQTVPVFILKEERDEFLTRGDPTPPSL